jgi:ferredoxin
MMDESTDREDLLNAMFEDDELVASAEVPSHITAPRDEDGDLQLVRYTYVDEDTCIGCTYCADIARNTFFMEQDIKGAARVFNQGGDTEEVIEEAIDACPVNCINYVSFEDLVTLENERLQREGNLDFNNYASFKRGWTGQAVAIPETNAKYYGSAASGAQCDNCPSRGCKDCPMFGVGQNPVYLKRLKKREQKKEESGEAARERFDKAAQETIDVIYSTTMEEGEIVPTGEADDENLSRGSEADGEDLNNALDVLFNDDYSMPGFPDEPGGPGEGQVSRDRENLQW